MIQRWPGAPGDWKWMTLADAVGSKGLFVDGDWVESKDQDPNGDVRLVQLADVGDGNFRDRSNRFLTSRKAFELGCTFLRRGDVLVARMPDPLGRACLFPGSTRPCVTVVDVCVIRADEGYVTSDWLVWVINSPRFRSQVNGLQAGTTRKRISRRNLGSIVIPVPSIEQQRQIVPAINGYMSRIDAACSSLAVAQRRLAPMVNVLLRTAVPLPPVAHWKLKTVAEAGTVTLGRQRSPRYHEGANMKPYLRVANVFEDRIDVSDVMEMHFGPAEFERFRLVQGDIVLNEGQTPELLGRAAMYRGKPENVAFTNSLLRFKAGPEVDPEWALLVFRRHLHAGRFAAESRITTNIAHLSAGRFSKVEFPVPPIAEQLERAGRVRAQLSLTETLDRAISVAKKKANILRSAVLDTAFTGRLPISRDLRQATNVSGETVVQESA